MPEEKMTKEQLLQIKGSLPDARKQVRESLTGMALQEALKRYDDTEKWVDSQLMELHGAQALKQPVSDEKRLGLVSLWRTIGKTLWNHSEKKQLKEIRKFIGSRETGQELSMKELHSFAKHCALLGNQKSIAVRPDAGYWKKFQILLSGILAVTNDEAMEALPTIFSYDDSPETWRENVEKEKRSLAQWWDIYDTDSAVNTIYWLLQRGHTGRYDAFSAAQTIQDGMEVQRQELRLLLQDEYGDDVNFPPDNATLEEVVGFEVDKYLLEHSRIVEQYLDDKGTRYDGSARNQERGELRQQTLERFMQHHKEHVRDIMDFIRKLGADEVLRLNAWDIGRCANVVRWSYTCGYLTEKQAWAFLDRNARRAVKEYGSFGEFAHDYMIGRFFWQGGNSGSVEIKTTYYMMESLQYLFDSQIGMWSQNPWVSQLVTEPE